MDADLTGPAASRRLEPVGRLLHLIFAADDSDQLLHHDLEVTLDGVGVFTVGGAGERLEGEGERVASLTSPGSGSEPALYPLGENRAAYSPAR